MDSMRRENGNKPVESLSHTDFVGTFDLNFDFTCLLCCFVQ
jgi:hypothetical protein